MVALVLASCREKLDHEEFTVAPSSSSVAVGEASTLTVSHTEVYGADDRQERGLVSPSEFVWLVQPPDGVTLEDGVFTALVPGAYTVSLDPTSIKAVEPRVISATISVVGEAKDLLLFENHNVGAVQNGGTSPTFEIPSAATITEIETYHWNDGSGSATTGEVSLEGDDGRVYGPWPTEGTPGQGGVPNAYWTATADVELPPGNYTVVDSDPATWSQNADSGGQGMVRVYADPTS